MDNDLCLPQGVVGTYSLVGGVLKLAAVTKERKASNCRRDSALWRVSNGRTIGIPTESVLHSPSRGISFKFGADDDPDITAVEKRCTVDDPFADNSVRNLR